MTSELPSLPRRLERDDVLVGFDSGASELDEWLTRYAYVNLRANNAITYVTVYENRVVGYYAIAVASVERDKAPERLQKGRPSHIPCILIARLAVDRSMQGKKLGAGLLRDALERSSMVSDSVGAAAVLVHARDDVARAFYLAHGDFLSSPYDELQLFAPMKEIKKLFR